MSNRMRIPALIGALGLAAAVSAAAGEPIDETKTAPADGTVSIDNLIGSIRVEGWEKNEIHITGSLGKGPEGLEFDVKGDRTVIKVVWPERGGRNIDDGEETDLFVKLPLGSHVEASGVNTEISISGVTGEVEAEAVNGSIVVKGDPQSVDVETVNGSIEVEGSSADVNAETVNGSVTIAGARGEVSAASVNGEIEIDGGPFQSAEVGTVSGSIEFRGDITGDDEFSFETHSGRVEIYLPADIQADFEGSTFSGKIRNDFGPEAERTSKYAPGMELEFSTGAGGPTISASSFSGRVELRKK